MHLQLVNSKKGTLKGKEDLKGGPKAEAEEVYQLPTVWRRCVAQSVQNRRAERARD
jgi:hypothetical protein